MVQFHIRLYLYAYDLTFRLIDELEILAGSLNAPIEIALMFLYKFVYI